MLFHYAEYLKGAKDPDNVFKDFENHVLHVSDGYWGGAAKTCDKWLEKCMQMLSDARWKEAAYAIGVLSHYFTDPFMPLHTAQSPRETVVHRPLEWSVCCAYTEIFDLAYADTSLESFAINPRNDWIQDAVMRGATMSNQDYEPLIDDYRIELAKSPKLALPDYSRKILAKIFVWVITGWGQALELIANHTDTPFPDLSLTLPTLLAGIQVPMKQVVAKINASDQRLEVERVLNEYARTGQVVRNLAPEQKTVAKVRETNPDLRPPDKDIARFNSEFARPAIQETPNVKSLPREDKPVKQEEAVIQPIINLERDEEPRVAIPTMEIEEETSAKGRKRLFPSSPIVDAPAIGPKTAARFHAIGFTTIADLIRSKPDAIARRLAVKWITARLVEQWQDQARLALAIDRLTAVGAGLLTLAGIRTALELCKYSSEEVHAKLCSASKTAEGQRMLRDQPPPSIKTIDAWIASARTSTAAHSDRTVA